MSSQLSEFLPYILIGLGVLIPLIIIMVLVAKRNAKKRKAKEHAPEFKFYSCQIAPLGKDISFKIKNFGNNAIVERVGVKGRNDIKVSSAYTNFNVESNRVYGIFLEVTGKERASKQNFDIELFYHDTIGNSYTQLFHVDKNDSTMSKPKVLKYA